MNVWGDNKDGRLVIEFAEFEGFFRTNRKHLDELNTWQTVTRKREKETEETT
jgi:hypothetical protein